MGRRGQTQQGLGSGLAFSTIGIVFATIIGGFIMGFAVFWMSMARTIGLPSTYPIGMAFMIIPRSSWLH